MNKNFINKRKKNILNINLRIIIISTFAFFFITLFYLNYYKIINFSVSFIEKYSNQYNYTLLNIEVSDLNNLDEKEILQYFDPYFKKSVFLIPLKKISTEINLNNWVKNIKIENNFKDTITINIEEEIPFGIYDNNNQKVLFSDNLIVLEIINKNNKYEDLIIFYGKNSINHSKELLGSIKNHLKDLIISATFIENRRWNIELNNAIVLKLPHENITQALNNYKKIYQNFSNNELNDIESIDLRIINKAIIKYRNNYND